jgi:hypothetical protein
MVVYNNRFMASSWYISGCKRGGTARYAATPPREKRRRNVVSSGSKRSRRVTNKTSRIPAYPQTYLSSSKFFSLPMETSPGGASHLDLPLPACSVLGSRPLTEAPKLDWQHHRFLHRTTARHIPERCGEKC